MTIGTSNIHFRFQGLLSVIQWFINLLTTISRVTTSIMFHLVIWYDLYMYTPLQAYLSPYVTRIPRVIRIGNKSFTVFNANIVTYSRTVLIIPIAWCLKCNYPILACSLILFHDFLDHIDGIVAKVHKRIYGDNIDDPLLGGFMDAFCDKVVNVFCLWTIIQEIHIEQTSTLMAIVFVLLCYTIIALETAIGVVRVQDYFHATLLGNKTTNKNSTAAVMEGKLKEKFESIGLAFLCLSIGHTTPFEHWTGILGVVCLVLTLRLAYISLTKKLEARKSRKEKKNVTIKEQPEEIQTPVQKSIAVINTPISNNDANTRQRAMTLDSSQRENEKSKHVNAQTPPIFSANMKNPMIVETTDSEDDSHSTSSSDNSDEPLHSYQRSASLPSIWIDGRADKVYTVGCFDLFHEGHRLLLQRMRQYGRQVIVGVHDSRSIHKLKKRVPVDGTETRMLNVKRYADEVYCVAGTDPSNFVKCIVHLQENETAVYIRGDDMADFPSRHVVEELMPIKFLPYTNGVSSTQLRKELFSHIQADDMEHLENVN
ncbi:unnamed protein product [Adineta ricciae]|uniref:Cytidyltransferase-like domain-containing protein n=1 Tax=Adineta ricciae TaxID=249248 RepID=A0A815ZYD3_ADIRI|nr:unnamed protein product [Adineta ricciae]